MIKRLFCTCIAATALVVTGKMVSDYAETKPGLKNVKEKLKKTGKDFISDFKEVVEAAKRASWVFCLFVLVFLLFRAAPTAY